MTASGALQSGVAAQQKPLVPAMTRWRDRIALRPDVPNAYDRILRRFALSIGLGGVIMCLAEVPEMAQQGRVEPLWWTPTAATLLFACFPVLAVSAVTLPPRLIRRIAAVAAVGYLAALATMPLALHPHILAAESPWPYRMVPLGVLAAALAWPVRWVAVYLVGASAAGALCTIYLVEPFTALSVLSAFARIAGLSALLVWCFARALSAAVRVDRESAVAGRRAAAQAAAAARDHERARFAALIHDAVLSTLLDASRGERSNVLRRQAERTLEQLDEIRVDVREPDVLDARAAVIFLRSAVHEINPGVRFATRTWPGFDDLRMPVQVAGTLAAALGESVRNSLRHAAVPGREVQRTVTCTISAGGLRLVFSDDGAGFDVGKVPVDRLGVSVSILGRMRQLPGGAGFVESQPGEGTSVTLVWGGDGAQ